ncbi:MAG: TonB-dependent receptor [Pseudomonadota bacterium]
MKNRIQIISCILFVLFFYPRLTAAEDISLGTVIINSGSENTDQEYSGFSTVVKKERTNIKSQDVPSLIEKNSGIQVRQTGGLGSFSSVSLRGASSDKVMVFIDGIPMNDSSGSGVDLSNIPSSDIESIEIYKGVTPITLGRSSIGGAINIKTIRANKELKGNVTTSYSSFNTFKIAPALSQKLGAFDYLISGEYLSSKNDFTILNNNSTPLNPLDDTWERRNNAQFSQKSILTDLGYDFTKNYRVLFSNQYFDKGQNLANMNNDPTAQTKFSTTRNMSALKLTMNDLSSNHLNTEYRVDYTYKREYYDNRYGTLGTGKQYNRYRTNNYGYNQLFEWPTQYNILDAVFDFHREEYTATDLLYNNYNAPHSRNMYTLSAEDKMIFFSDKFILSPALSYQYYDDTKSGHLNPKLGVKYQLAKFISLKTNAAQYIREPSFYELYGNRGYFVGSSSLKAERGLNFDIGADVSYINDGSNLSKVSFSAAYFMSSIQDVITYVYDSTGVGHAVNMSSTFISGVEGSLAINFLKYFTLSSNYTWQQPTNKSSSSLYDGKKLPGRFENSFALKLDGKYSFISAYYEFSYEDGLFYDAANLLPAPVKRVHDLGVSGTVSNFIITAEVKNIADDHYEDFNGFPTPGRSYWLTLRYDI